MPEGPEIIITTQYLISKLKNKIIKEINIIGGRYTHEKLDGIDLIKNKLLKVSGIDSKGKFMWMKLTDEDNKDIYLLNTFGMTGRWSFTYDKSARLKIVVKSNKENKTYNLFFIDQRNFGTIQFTENISELDKKINKLAPDILKTNMTDSNLIIMINKLIDKYNSKKNKKDLNIVKVLMDQELLVSGIGNYLVAEILYDAKINPHRSILSLNDNEIKTLAHSMRAIPKYAYYDNNSGYMEYFKSFMTKHSDRIDKGIFPNFHSDIKPLKDFKFKVYQKKKDPYDNEVINDVIVKNRTIHWVPTVQL